MLSLGGGLGASRRDDALLARVGAIVRAVLLEVGLVAVVLALVEEGRVVAEGEGGLHAGRLREHDALVEGAEAGDEDEADDDTPDRVELRDLAVDVDALTEAREDDDRDDAADEVAPTLHREDEGEHETATVEVGAVRDDRGAHGVVAADADLRGGAWSQHRISPSAKERWKKATHAHDDTPDGDPGKGLGTVPVRRSRDGHNDTEHGDDEAERVDLLAAVDVAEHAETDLTDDASEVGGGLEHTTLEGSMEEGTAGLVVVPE